MGNTIHPTYPENIQTLLNKLPKNKRNKSLIIQWLRENFKKERFLESLIKQLNNDSIKIRSFKISFSDNYNNLYLDIGLHSKAFYYSFDVSVSIDLEKHLIT